MTARFAVTVHQSTTYNGDDVLAHTITTIPSLPVRGTPLVWDVDHVDLADRGAFLTELARCIDPDGHLLLVNRRHERASLYPARDIHRIEVHA